MTKIMERPSLAAERTGREVSSAGSDLAKRIYEVTMAPQHLEAARSCVEVVVELANGRGDALATYLRGERTRGGRPLCHEDAERAARIAAGAMGMATSGPVSCSSRTLQTAPEITRALAGALHVGERALVEMSGGSLRVLANMLDAQWRLASGQLKIALELFSSEIINGRIDEDGRGRGHEAYEKAGLAERPYREIVCNDPSRSYGLGSVSMPALADDGYTLRRAILHRLAWDRDPGGGMAIDFDKPTAYGRSSFVPTLVYRGEDGGDADVTPAL